MNQLMRKNVVELARRRAEPSVSIFMPFRSEPDQEDQNRLRLKNLATAAHARLVEDYGLRSPAAESLLEPARRLAGNGRFRAAPGTTGIALYLTAGDQTRYDLPIAFEERVVVSDRFYLKPLMPLLAHNGRFYLLALSLGQVQLFEGTQYGIHSPPLRDGIPQSLEDAMRWDDPEQRLQWHTSTAGTGTAERPAAFHGHGVIGDETKKENILRFFQQLDAGLQTALPDEEVPLVLAAVAYLLPIYRQANSDGRLLAEALAIDPQSLTGPELHRRVWNEVMEPYFARKQVAAAANFNDLAGTERVSTDLAEVVRAAHYGQIDILFAAKGREQWGIFDKEKGQVVLHDTADSGSYDLIDRAAVQTLLHSGNVYVMEQNEVPQQEVVAAIFRYAG